MLGIINIITDLRDYYYHDVHVRAGIDLALSIICPSYYCDARVRSWIVIPGVLHDSLLLWCQGMIMS